MATQYQIIPLEANLRSQPKLVASTVLVQLKQGQQVDELPAPKGTPAGWRRVRAEVQGTPVEGFIKSFLLKKLDQAPVITPPAVLPTLPEAHLTPPGAVRVTNRDWWAYSLNDPKQPGRTSAAIADRAQDLGQIVTYLHVESAARYRRTSTATYCNIYVHDYCHLAGVYLPRVWWQAKALAQLLQRQPLKARYGTTVVEYNVNALYNWLEEFGPDFGWRRTTSLTDLQQAANLGQVCIIAAQRTNLNAAGHIVAVVPETNTHKASRKGNAVTTPLQSQAGATNFRYGGRVWWTGTQFRRFGFWIHA